MRTLGWILAAAPLPTRVAFACLVAVLVFASAAAGEPPAPAGAVPGPDLAAPSDLNRGQPGPLLSPSPFDPGGVRLPADGSQGPLFSQSLSGRRDPPPDLSALAAEDAAWEWQILPDGLIYRSYLAGPREPRFSSQWNYERNLGWLWDVALGGRAGIFRYGTPGAYFPKGWEADIEGAAFPRLDLEHNWDLTAADFRFGIPLTYGYGRYQMKIAYYHLSSHLGDEFMLRVPDAERINYVRNAIVWGHSYYLTDDFRLYAEAGWSFYSSGGAEPWEFQFGVEYSPFRPSGISGAPFVAVNAHLHEEVDFGGNFVVQTGWQWRGQSGQLFRAGMQYFTGKSEQYEFFRQHEDKLGLGVWYDF